MSKPARWRSIRYEEIATGFVSTSSNVAIFSRTIGSFGPHPAADTAGEDRDENEAWCRFRFAPMPTVMAKASKTMFGERAVVGAEVCSNNTPQLQILLRCDGMLCLKKQSAQALPHVSIEPLATALAPPQVSANVLAATTTTAAAQAETAPCSLAAAGDDFAMWRCPATCVFTPSSTIAVRAQLVENNTAMHITWLVFGSAFSADSSSLVCSLSFAVPLAAVGLAADSVVSCEACAGQSEALCIVGNRMPRSSYSSSSSMDDETSTPTAEFSADYIVAPPRMVQAAPSLLLSLSGVVTGTGRGGSASPVMVSPSRGAAAHHSEGSLSDSSSGFSNAEVLRLAMSSPTVSRSLPTYLSLRAENCFERLENLVHS